MFGNIDDNNNKNNEGENNSTQQVGLFGNVQSQSDKQPIFEKHNQNKGFQSIFQQQVNNEGKDQLLFGQSGSLLGLNKNYEQGGGLFAIKSTNKTKESEGGLFGISKKKKQNNNNNSAGYFRQKGKQKNQRQGKDSDTDSSDIDDIDELKLIQQNKPKFGQISCDQSDFLSGIKNYENKSGSYEQQNQRLFGNIQNKNNETNILFTPKNIQQDGDSDNNGLFGQVFNNQSIQQDYKDQKLSREFQNKKQKWLYIYTILKNQFRNIIDKRATWRIFYNYVNITSVFQVSLDQYKFLANIPLQLLQKTFHLSLDIELCYVKEKLDYEKLVRVFSSLKDLKKLVLIVGGQFYSNEDVVQRNNQTFSRLIKQLPQQLQSLSIVNYSYCSDILKEILKNQTGFSKLWYFQKSNYQNMVLKYILQKRDSYKNLKELAISTNLSTSADSKENIQNIQYFIEDLGQFLNEFEQIRTFNFQFQSMYPLVVIDNAILEVFNQFGDITKNKLKKLQLCIDLLEDTDQDIHLFQKIFSNMDTLEFLELTIKVSNNSDELIGEQSIGGEIVPKQLRERGFLDILQSIQSLQYLTKLALNFNVKKAQNLFETQRKFVATHIETKFLKNQLKQLPRLKEISQIIRRLNYIDKIYNYYYMKQIIQFKVFKQYFRFFSCLPLKLLKYQFQSTELLQYIHMCIFAKEGTIQHFWIYITDNQLLYQHIKMIYSFYSIL